jgi:hypothetical protein
MISVTTFATMRTAVTPLRLPWEGAGQTIVPPPHASDFASMLTAQGLAPLWSDLAESGHINTPETLRCELLYQRRLAAARYLLQRWIGTQASACLHAEGIAHALFKGAAVRERLYADPALRPADDLDLLVAPQHRDQAILALIRAGFCLQGDRRIISHETNLIARHVAVDLHWHLLRPGRSRCELAPRLLATARPLGTLCGLGDDANLLVMLVHPAFAKHVNGRAAKLIRVVDLDRMLRMTQPDWDWILPLIDAAGLRTAAWAVLYWTRSLMDTPVDPAVLRHLEPGRLKGRYLTYWIDHLLPARLEGIPGLVQGAFTLALHERAGDALHAIAQRMRTRVQSRNTLKHLKRISQTPA